MAPTKSPLLTATRRDDNTVRLMNSRMDSSVTTTQTLELTTAHCLSGDSGSGGQFGFSTILIIVASMSVRSTTSVLDRCWFTCCICRRIVPGRDDWKDTYTTPDPWVRRRTPPKNLDSFIRAFDASSDSSWRRGDGAPAVKARIPNESGNATIRASPTIVNVALTNPVLRVFPASLKRSSAVKPASLFKPYENRIHNVPVRVGEKLGTDVGPFEGEADGILDGALEGDFVGTLEGENVG
mmetsp:Transcript_8890/g.13757  ORF Transcript_8890/g.13757 Transcript_8890/m.13757 type:complete len:239 (-) Transcript_8890:43-759(-)